MKNTPSLSSATDRQPDAVLALLREIVELLNAIQELENEQVHTLRMIRMSLP